MAGAAELAWPSLPLSLLFGCSRLLEVAGLDSAGHTSRSTRGACSFMNTQLISDRASLDRQRKLLAAFETLAFQHEQAARSHFAANCIEDANEAQRQAINFRTSTIVIRRYLIAATGLTLDDVAPDVAEANALTAQINDEPPATLVGLTDWLREKLGRFFPWVPDKGWQTIGFVLMCGRPS